MNSSSLARNLHKARQGWQPLAQLAVAGLCLSFLTSKGDSLFAQDILHVLVDACSVEVFVSNGEAVLTSLVFPSMDSRGMEFFGPSGAKIESLRLWNLKAADVKP
ncbi:MAG TPA: GH32 C-terminal domain-containing protein [Candidatus Acidoferrum sp.]|jgi:hypothetical protein|nr:GH32 C-terminal domain-containing protein [Candidatus Acidoferrum sp.]